MLIIRKAEVEDCPSITLVHTNTVRAISDSRYTPEEIEAWAIPRSPDDYEQLVNSKEFYVAVENNVIVAFGVLNQVSRVIEAVYVSPEASNCSFEFHASNQRFIVTSSLLNDSVFDSIA